MPERNNRTPEGVRPERENSKETEASPESISPELLERAAANEDVEAATRDAETVTAATDAARERFGDDAEAAAELDEVVGFSERAKQRVKEIEAELARGERLADLNEATNAGAQAAIELLRARFEDVEDDKEKLPFHNAGHSVGVAARTRKILEAIERGAPELVDERTVEIGQLAAIFHDSVQKWVPVETKEGDFTKVMRKRLASPADAKAVLGAEDYAGNEAASAAEAIKFIDGYDAKRRADGLAEVYTDEDKEVIRRAIDATIPGFDPEKGTVVQPRLVKESSVITRAVALSDLGESGMDPEGYLKAGDALFREENLDILEASKDPKGLSDAQKEYYRKRMLGWSKFQPKFAAGRKARLEQELEGLPEAAAAEVRKLFTKFDESVEGAAAAAAKRENMTFDELMADMGYESEAPASGEGSRAA